MTLSGLKLSFDWHCWLAWSRHRVELILVVRLLPAIRISLSITGKVVLLPAGCVVLVGRVMVVLLVGARVVLLVAGVRRGIAVVSLIVTL